MQNTIKMSIKVVEMTAMRTYPPKKVLDVSLLKLEAKLAVHSLTESELAWLIVSCPLLQQYLLHVSHLQGSYTLIATCGAINLRTSSE